ncbi:MAG: DUF1045 domain-containing protein [Lautropia sp.]
MRRFALYWKPDAGHPLTEAAAAWFASADAAAWGDVAEARRYGFHATLKAPFRLAAGGTPEQLQAAATAIAASRPAFTLPPLRVDLLDGFAALRADADGELQSLADALVMGLDPFRAPLDEADRRRRRVERLDPPARALLERWGYPFVLSNWRFHLTLTGPLSGPPTGPPPGPLTATAIAPSDAIAALARHFAAALREPVRCDAIHLVGEPDPGADFVDIARLPLASARARIGG